MSAEVSLCAVCLLVAGLLLHSFVRILAVEPGFDAASIVTVDVNLFTSRYSSPESRTPIVRGILTRLSAEPGVVSVGMTNKLPLAGLGSNSALWIEGAAAAIPLLERPLGDIRTVSSDYLRTMGIALRAGRMFDDRDEQRPVAVVSQATADRAWPGQSPVGKRFQIGRGDRPMVEVVGVATDVRAAALDQSSPLTVYIPYWQGVFISASLAIKTAADPGATTAAVRAAVRDADPDLPLSAFRTMNEIVDASVAQRRFQLNLVLLFGAAAVSLAALGIYGVVSFSVSQRTQEIGIRIALGAERAVVRWMVMLDAWRVVAAGLLAGVPVAVAAGFGLRALLFEVAPTEVIAIGGVCVLILVVATAAAYLPARRASLIDPMVALRHE